MQTSERVKVDITQEDLINYYYNKFLLEWVKKNKPELCKKIKKLLKDEIGD